MRRLLLIALAAAVAVPAPAQASKASAWKRVLRSQHAPDPSPRIVVRPGHMGRSTVSVVIAARVASEPVLFADDLYGATAWHWNGRRWKRADTALFRPAVVRELDPGQRVRVRLPIERRPRRVRVLVPIPTDRAGAWADVRR